MKNRVGEGGEEVEGRVEECPTYDVDSKNGLTYHALHVIRSYRWKPQCLKAIDDSRFKWVNPVLSCYSNNACKWLLLHRKSKTGTQWPQNMTHSSVKGQSDIPPTAFLPFISPSSDIRQYGKLWTPRAADTQKTRYVLVAWLHLRQNNLHLNLTPPTYV